MAMKCLLLPCLLISLLQLSLALHKPCRTEKSEFIFLFPPGVRQGRFVLATSEFQLCVFLRVFVFSVSLSVNNNT